MHHDIFFVLNNALCKGIVEEDLDIMNGRKVLIACFRTHTNKHVPKHQFPSHHDGLSQHISNTLHKTTQRRYLIIYADVLDNKFKLTGT